MTVSTKTSLLSTRGALEIDDRDNAEWLEVARAFMNNPNLVVLAGSGCSFGLQGRGRRAPMMSDLLVMVEGLPSWEDLIHSRPEFESIRNVEELLSSVQAAASLSHDPGIELRFLQESTTAIRDACDFVDATTDLSSHEAMIRKLANRDTRQERLELFTTNYDLAFETALQNVRFTAIDGFGYGSRARFSGSNFRQDIVIRGPRGELNLAPSVVRLLKLHGSVDWDEGSDGIRRSTNPTNPVLIYPSMNKYRQSYRQPYMEAIARLQTSLRKAETSVLTVGFGFNDDHLTQPLIDALMGEPTLRLLVVCPEAITGNNATLQKLRGSIAVGDSRVTLLATTMSELARLLPERSDADPWQARQDALAHIWTSK